MTATTTLDEIFDALEARYARIEAELDGLHADERPRVRGEIVGLFRETESALERLTEFRDRIRTLVDRYKSSAPAQAPSTGLAPAAPPRSDHIGSTTYMERGWSAIAAGDAERAIAELRRALQLAPDDPEAESLLGWAQMLAEQYDDALFTYQKVLMRQPENPLARVNVGYICLKKGIFGEAIEHLARAIRLDADRKATMYAHFYMGLVYLEREMYADARSFFRRTLELGPNLLEAYWEIGRAFYLEGDRESAAAAWREGHEKNRFNLWGERCGDAVRAVEAGEAVEV